jgi:putative ABC transport system substrate-binding protein
VRSPDEIDRAFSTMAKQRPDAFVMFPSVMFFIERRRVIDLAEKHRLPSIYVSREFVDIGGLFSYGASIADLFRRTAVYVDKILRAPSPPTRPLSSPPFELVINPGIAKGLGDHPPSPAARR